jgi:hypothetical protein
MATPDGMAATALRQAAKQWLDLHHFLGHQLQKGPSHAITRQHAASPWIKV